MWIAALDGAWRVLVAGLVLGAGLPILFALGVKSLAWANGDLSGTPRNPAGRLVAAGLFAVVVIAILLGIGYIVAHGFGYVIGWDGLLPTMTKK
ncbi:MAG: hypothetical protein R2719_06010 [Micropruina sp.]|nr:hypothetical protein [Micropruina sp.]